MKLSRGINVILTVMTMVLLTIASIQFITYNSNIIKNIPLFSGVVILSILMLLFVVAQDIRKPSEVAVDVYKKIAVVLSSLLVIALIVMMFMQSVVVDYFQPLSLYDQVIYLAIGGYVLIIVRLLIESIKTVITSTFNKQTIWIMASAVLLMGCLWGWNTLQDDFEYENAENVYHVFEAGEAGYDIFRIPTVLVVPNNSQLKNGEILSNDTIIVMAEARRNGSSDHGDIDLVQKRSLDGGLTWSELELIREWEPGIGKIGNSTPVFDQITGQINLVHIAGETPAKTKTYSMTSDDGGITWTEAILISDGIVGPGHGIQITSGTYENRLVVPGYKDGGSYVLYSDDHGKSWTKGEQFDDGNECEVTQVNDEGRLMIAVRTIHPVSQPHEELHKLFAFSDDGGATWSDLKENAALKEPVCMSSVVRADSIYYSYPNDYYSRSNMTIANSKDEGVEFDNILSIYNGPAGYSDLGVTADQQLVLVFENGAVEYDERITFLKVKK